MAPRDCWTSSALPFPHLALRLFVGPGDPRVGRRSTNRSNSIRVRSTGWPATAAVRAAQSGSTTRTADAVPGTTAQ